MHTICFLKGNGKGKTKSHCMLAYLDLPPSHFYFYVFFSIFSKKSLMSSPYSPHTYFFPSRDPLVKTTHPFPKGRPEYATFIMMRFYQCDCFAPSCELLGLCVEGPKDGITYDTLNYLGVGYSCLAWPILSIDGETWTSPKNNGRQYFGSIL